MRSVFTALAMIACGACDDSGPTSPSDPHVHTAHIRGILVAVASVEDGNPRLSPAFIPPLGEIDTASLLIWEATEVIDERTGQQRRASISDMEVGQEIHADVEEIYFPDIIPQFSALRIFIVADDGGASDLGAIP